jgi:hypothetical protein
MARLTDRPPPGPTPPQSPFLPPQPRPPRPQLPPAEPRLHQRGLASLSLAVLSLLAMLLIGNLQRAGAVAAVALVVAVVALFLAFSSLSMARSAGTARPRGAMPGVVLGLLSALISGVALLGFLIFGPQITQYATCMDQANTTAEHQACQDQLRDSINARIGVGNR